ncbi:hypothetical protein SEPCBS119000_000701 [Sporothrix epigloea]|uniref:SET domain-containing protein n=1 Tax=Sporothrix epigloea TaxID=1892477 RepID=A0ABP0D7J7_9PEZI
MADKAAGSHLPALLEQRQQLTDELVSKAYDMILWLRRAVVYTDMGYPDLAIGDAYRALRLTGQMRSSDEDFFEETYEGIRAYAYIVGAKGLSKGWSQDLPEVLRNVTPGKSSTGSKKKFRSVNRDFDAESAFGDDPLYSTCHGLAHMAKIRSCQIISLNLLLCGCLGSAYRECEYGLKECRNDRELLQIKALIDTAARHRLRQSGSPSGKYNPADLPDRGFARREVYPWNTYEPDRCSDASLAFLNEQLAEVAPKCEVRAVELPVLAARGLSEGPATSTTRRQLGIFAKEPIAAGEVVLREYSLLTASQRPSAEGCDACGSDLPDMKNAIDINNSRADCGISGQYRFTEYCGEECFKRAQDAYLGSAYSPMRIFEVGNFNDPRDADDALYLQLLTRVLTVAARRDKFYPPLYQKLHPLENKEVKYLWGDFVPTAINAQEAISLQSLSPFSPEVVAMAAAGAYPPAAWSLPFNLVDNIVGPLVRLEEMNTNIFDEEEGDVWVLNTLFAKLRGTASARKGRQDGPPVVAALHPLWSLANHDCDPNVTWEWGGRMVLRAKEERVQLAEDKATGRTRPGGIAAGEEILSHYCDVDLPVQLRRAWARGSLGGTCMCQRCQNEAVAE